MTRWGALRAMMLALWLAVSSPGQSMAAEFEAVRVSGKDRAAVIRTPEGRLALIVEGGRIPGVGRVVEISEERIVIDGSADIGGERLLIPVKGGCSQAARVRRTGGTRPGLFAPGRGQGP